MRSWIGRRRMGSDGFLELVTGIGVHATPPLTLGKVV